MLKTIKELKNSAIRLEKAYNSFDKESFNKELQLIKEASSALAYIHDESYAEEAFAYELHNIRVLNTIPFLVKTVEVDDVYESNYLEKFCEERTDQLMKAMAINHHNEFWKQHATVNGNIYGSVPLELLRDETVRKLLNYGWVEVDVDIIDLSSASNDRKEVLKFCRCNFDRFIVVNEVSTNTLLVLRYNM